MRSKVKRNRVAIVIGRRDDQRNAAGQRWIDAPLAQTERLLRVGMHGHGLWRPSSDGHILLELLLVGLRGPARIGLVKRDLSLQMLVFVPLQIRLFQRVCHYEIPSWLSH